MKRIWQDYNLSIVLTALFLTSFWLQSWTGWRRFQAEERAHGETATVFGESGYVWTWGEATFENWQSEFLQLLTFVVLTAVLIHKGSHESKDSDDRLEKKIDAIGARLERLEAASGPPSVSNRTAHSVGEPDRSE
jgi:hypothetical protein